MGTKQSKAAPNTSDLNKRKLGARKGRTRYLKTTRRMYRSKYSEKGGDTDD